VSHLKKLNNPIYQKEIDGETEIFNVYMKQVLAA
jgi:hypothetical protein